MNKILFDANSTSTTSATIYVPPGSCVLLNSWNLNMGELAEVFRLLVAPGVLPPDPNGSSCNPFPPLQPAQILDEEPYVPCNAPVALGLTATQDVTSLVLSQPGYYNLHLTPAALGTAFVEAVFLTGADACAQAASTCCCEPQLQWAGTSASPCLSITPGGPLGNEPVFDLDPCCVLQQIVTVGVPTLTDQIVVMQGGLCIRASLDDIFGLVNTCSTIASFPILAPAAGDTLVAVDNTNACKRLDASAAVAAFETPWAGVSATPALTITPGGTNGHAPTFTYDWCADLQAQTVCSCEPTPGDLVPIVQGGACVLATWPTVDVCDQLNLLTTGATAVGDLVPVVEAGGICKLVLATELSGGITFPILAPNGSCAAPSYSFTADPTSGMWFNPALGPAGAVVISDHNCANEIRVGASIVLNTSLSDIQILAADNLVAVAGAGIMSLNANAALTITSGASTVSVIAATSFGVTTAGVARISINSAGAWDLAGDVGAANEVITSQGVGLPPVWGPVTATITFPLLAPTSATPQFSFAAQTGMGMAMDGAQLHFGSLDTLSPVWSVSSRLSIDTGVTGDMLLTSSRGDGSRAGRIDITGGNALNPGVQVEGGPIAITGGNSNQATGGDITISGGNTTVVGAGSPISGNVTINGGNSDSRPGNILIRTAASSNTFYAGLSGNITLRTDAFIASTGAAPAFRMDHHNDQPYGYNCLFDWPGAAQSQWRIANVSGNGTNPQGQSMIWRGGAGANVLNSGHGGHLEFIGGNAFAAGNARGGSVLLAGGTPSGVATKGYVQLERVTVAPVTAPQPEAGYAPVVIFDDGVNVHLVAWCQSVGAWQNV